MDASMGLQEFRGLMSRACNEAWLQQLTYERLQAGVSSAPQDPTADYEHPEQGSYPKTIPLTPFGLKMQTVPGNVLDLVSPVSPVAIRARSPRSSEKRRACLGPAACGEASGLELLEDCRPCVVESRVRWKRLTREAAAKGMDRAVNDLVGAFGTAPKLRRPTAVGLRSALGAGRLSACSSSNEALKVLEEVVELKPGQEAPRPEEASYEEVAAALALLQQAKEKVARLEAQRDERRKQSSAEAASLRKRREKERRSSLRQLLLRLAPPGSAFAKPRGAWPSSGPLASPRSKVEVVEQRCPAPIPAA
ncbi:unnamed protein product [Durusdinium trenchii]|uniref:Uncharacterized protein n=1 Tax=Durusdinium trenchii TaxID=1381693 RepID=A0ABP0JH63_9DINO